MMFGIFACLVILGRPLASGQTKAKHMLGWFYMHTWCEVRRAAKELIEMEKPGCMGWVS